MIFKTRTKYFNAQDRQVGNSVIIKKDIPVEQISSIEEVYKELGSGEMKLMKTKCMLVCQPPIGNVIIEKSFDTMYNILENEKTRYNVFIKGFKRYDETK